MANATMATEAASQISASADDAWGQFVQTPLGAVLMAIVFTVATVAVFFVLDRIMRKLLRKFLYRDNIPLAGANFIAKALCVFLWAICAALILEFVFDLDVTAIITALGIGGLALSLAFQNTLSNLIAGFQISLMSIVDIGDRVNIEGTEGIVADVTWRHTTIEDYSGNTVTVPNSLLNSDAVLVHPDFVYTEVPVLIRYGSVPDDSTLGDVVAQIEMSLRAGVEAVADVVEGPVFRFKSTTEYGYAGVVCFKTKPPSTTAQVADVVVRKLGEL